MNIAVQVKKFASKGTAEYTQISATKPKILRSILDQGYNAAWSDADVYWLKNPFALFDRSPDLVIAWSNASELLEGGVYPAGELLSKTKPTSWPLFSFVLPSTLQTCALFVIVWPGCLAIILWLAFVKAELDLPLHHS